jgi:hypothetical protein
MTRLKNKSITLAAVALMVIMMVVFTPAPPIDAADHGDAPLVDQDQGADIADCFVFLDPNDNTKVVIIGTVHGFIIPGEARNFGAFDHNVRFRFEIENTGDAKPDQFIDITFSKRTAADAAQTATIILPNGQSFTAPSTVPTFDAAPPAPVITTNSANGATFFAGLVDDPFFFDLPAFNRFVASVKAGSPDPTTLQRGRDSFAGYNILCMALSVPATMLKGSGNVIGVDFLTQRRLPQVHTKDGDISGFGPYYTVDRTATPAVNVALIPFGRKNEYNASTTIDDANGKFASDIIATLTLFGTDNAHIGILANVAVVHGDFLRLDLTAANTGNSGGTNSGAGFPNGRRLADDVIDTILTLINNGNALGDNVNANDVPLRNSFPFVAPPHQPLPPGTIDDQTRN